MKEFLQFMVRAIPFTVGLILCLTALTYLIQFTDHDYNSGESFLIFVGLAAAGIPVILYGIQRLSNEAAL